MTQEEKELLFRDLCARLPYHIRCKIWLKDGTTEKGPLDLEHNYADVLLGAFYHNKIKDIKPYLRPMSSMTEEEKKEYDALYTYIKGCIDRKFKIDFSLATDWFNSHHFDYRGLIEKGLALEAPEGMYNVKEK